MYHELTENDIKKMEEEIEYRRVVVRKEKLEAVKEARAHGDLSENFEYYAAKRDKNKNESRIRYLEREIRTAKIIEDTAGIDEVGLFNTVTLYYEDEDEEDTVKIVTSLRVDATVGKVSNVSPIGKAIMGHRVGDRVYVELGKDNGYYVVIKKIEKTVDDGSDELREF
ncbi:MAG: transcription elongation factor GreA [Lachnospiraceae bacterium]|nr:transcription elongation factor GreA [Lachnospiraceae bacterium]